MLYKSFNFENIKILVVGDVMLDQYWHGHTTRISPEAPVPVTSIDKAENRLGGAGNVANNLNALGIDVRLFGYVGKDEAADILFKLLEQHGIAQSLIQLADYPTVTKLRILSLNQQLIRLDREKYLKNIDHSKLENIFVNNLERCNAVVLSDYEKGTLVDPQRLINIANKNNIPVIVDPKKEDFAYYAGASVITPNLKELQKAIGECSSEEVIIEKSRNLIKSYNLGALVVTRGADGMIVIPADDPAVNLPAKSSEVYDVTGAGDTVAAIVAAFLAKGCSIVEAARFATVAAGLVVAKIGTSSVSSDELQAAIFDEQLPLGVMEEKQLIKIIKIAQRRGEKIVFVNGCFDIIHYGHIWRLNKAKAMGHRLVIGVNSDASVTKLKGPARPVNRLEHRMAVLAALKSVDWVVPFSEDTPGRLVESLSPDILIKSYENFSCVEDIPATEGAAHVLQRGGQVHLLPRIAGFSSTNVLEHSS